MKKQNKKYYTSFPLILISAQMIYESNAGDIIGDFYITDTNISME